MATTSLMRSLIRMERKAYYDKEILVRWDITERFDYCGGRRTLLALFSIVLLSTPVVYPADQTTPPGLKEFEMRFFLGSLVLIRSVPSLSRASFNSRVDLDCWCTKLYPGLRASRQSCHRSVLKGQQFTLPSGTCSSD